MEKLTRQGVLDLDAKYGKRKSRAAVLPEQCDHKKMKQCHKDCGHWICESCGLSWDEGAQL